MLHRRAEQGKSGTSTRATCYGKEYPQTADQLRPGIYFISEATSRNSTNGIATLL